MIREMHPRLDAWEDDEAVKAVLITGEGEKAFCAGGDVRAVYRSIVDDLAGKGPSELSKSFFLEEYRLNHAITAFSKPYVAIRSEERRVGTERVRTCRTGGSPD